MFFTRNEGPEFDEKVPLVISLLRDCDADSDAICDSWCISCDQGGSSLHTGDGHRISLQIGLDWCVLIFWRVYRPDQVIPEINAISKEALAKPFTVDRAYFLSKENSWWRLKLLAYDDVGRLAVSDTQIIFQSTSRRIVIDQIRQVSYGK